MGDLRKEILMKTAGMPPPPNFKVPKSIDTSDFEAIPWTNYFDSSFSTPEGFKVYRTSFISKEEKLSCTYPYVLLLHGAGYTSLTWALVASELKKYVNVVAYDFRGHGATKSSDDLDFSSDTLSKDSLDIITQIIKSDYESLNCDIAQNPPNLVIAGHSMGGAIAARTAGLISSASNTNGWLKGLILLDIVEGSAMEALPSMQRVIKMKPTKFKSEAEAVVWAIKTKQVLNSISARVSIPSQLVSYSEQSSFSVSSQPSSSSSSLSPSPTPLLSSSSSSPSNSLGMDIFTWRLDLSATEPFWKGWYQGLSKTFLDVPVPKLLILAGTDRLDQELTIGQMQGKFQMVVMNQVGHVIQEDGAWCHLIGPSLELTRNKTKFDFVRSLSISQHPRLISSANSIKFLTFLKILHFDHSRPEDMEETIHLDLPLNRGLLPDLTIQCMYICIEFGN